MLDWRMRLASGEAMCASEIEEVLTIYEAAFGRAGWSSSGVSERSSTSAIHGFLEGAGQKVGYAFYSVPRTEIHGTFLLWEDAIGIGANAQRSGLGSRDVVWQSVSDLVGRPFGWIGGRTQNPAVAHRYLKQTRSKLAFPFRSGYTSDEGRELSSVLANHVAELRSEVVPDDGILRHAYRRRLNDFPAGSDPWDDPKFKGIVDWLRCHNFNRDNGDAVVVIAKLDAQIMPRLTSCPQ